MKSSVKLYFGWIFVILLFPHGVLGALPLVKECGDRLSSFSQIISIEGVPFNVKPTEKAINAKIKDVTVSFSPRAARVQKVNFADRITGVKTSTVLFSMARRRIDSVQLYSGSSGRFVVLKASREVAGDNFTKSYVINLIDGKTLIVDGNLLAFQPANMIGVAYNIDEEGGTLQIIDLKTEKITWSFCQDLSFVDAKFISPTEFNLEYEEKGNQLMWTMNALTHLPSFYKIKKILEVNK